MQDVFRFPIPSIDWMSILPTIIVALTGVLALAFEMISPKRNNNAIVTVCVLGLAAAAVPIVAAFRWPEETTLAGMFVRDRLGLVLQLLLVLSAALSILFSEGYLREKRIPFGEFYPLVCWSTVGAMVMVSTQNLLMIFLGLEVLSVALYVMAGMSRKEERSEESALKYFLLGAFASGFLLYGIAFVYGGSGSLDLPALSEAWRNGAYQPLMLFGVGLMLIGLGFKAAFVPFHQWTPDVYQGAPTNVTAFMAAGSKIAAIGALWRVLDGTSALQEYWAPALFWIAVLTMTVGNLAALVQKDVKRILGYSSIAHAGYILVAILAHFKRPDLVGSGTVAYYLLAYALMTIGSFAVVSLGAKAGREGTGLEDLHGMWQRSPLAAGTLVVLMASLIGVPPTAGFFGKFFIFGDAVSADLVALAIVMAVNSVISVYYYLGIAQAAFVPEERREAAPLNAGSASAALLCAAGVVLAAIFFAPLTRFLEGALGGIEPATSASVTRAGLP